MTWMLGGTLLALALLCAALMGLAIQRGTTCTVAAMEELLRGDKPRRLIALVEASLWVAGAVLVLRWFGLPPAGSAGYALTAWTLVGAALLGLGAVLNGACVFGAIARLGSGEWAYAATPLGYYIGCLTVDAVFGSALPQPLATDAPALAAPTWLAGLFGAFVLWRIGGVLRSGPLGLAPGSWSLHAATLVISVTFLAMLSLAGAWAHTDVLAELAQGVGMRASLALALLSGAVYGGWRSGRLRPTRPSGVALARSLGGGVLMGWGSLLLPGGNNGLVLLAMPLLWPYAWAAFATMCLVIGVGLWAPRAAARTA